MKEADFEMKNEIQLFQDIIYKWPEHTKWHQNTWLHRKVSENVSKTD